MSTLTFTKTPDLFNEYDHTTASVSTGAETLPDVLEAFASFLRASGYVFEGCHLAMVDDETDEPREYPPTKWDSIVDEIIKEAFRTGVARHGEATPPRAEGEVGSS